MLPNIMHQDYVGSNSYYHAKVLNPVTPYAIGFYTDSLFINKP